MRHPIRLALLAGAALLLAGVPAAVMWAAAEKESGEPAATEQEAEAGAFEVAESEPTALPEIAFQDAEGDPVTLADFGGKVVVLNLWATWCAPCRLEMPSLDRLQAELGGDDLQVVALSVDRAGLDKVTGFLDEVGAEHLDVYRDPEMAASRALGAMGLPTTVIIDREGREVGRVLGEEEWDGEAAKNYLRGVMAR